MQSLPQGFKLLCGVLPLYIILSASAWWNQRTFFRTHVSQHSAATTTHSRRTIPLPPNATAGDGTRTSSHLAVVRNESTSPIPTTTTTLLLYRWNSSSSHPGIDIMPLWQYMQSLATLPSSRQGGAAARNHYGPLPGWIDNGHQQASVRISRIAFRERSSMIVGRLLWIGPFLQETLTYFQNDLTQRDKETQFPFFTKALQKGGGMPLLMDVADLMGCWENNYNYTRSNVHNHSGGEENGSHWTTVSIPMITLSSSPSCSFSFAIPTYTVMKIAKKEVEDWDATFQRNDRNYPWHSKLRKVVWRGSLTDRGKWNTSILDIPRVYLQVLARNHSDIMDFAVPCKGRCAMTQTWLQWINRGDFLPSADFQKYRAVLDIDGMSWSERFPRLLCQNSVVIKVDPAQVEYFWPTLEAGVHYLAANLSTVVAVAQYATSDDHQEEMQRIIANAHEWCRTRMLVRQVQADILSVLDGFAKELYRGDPNWHRHIVQLEKLKLVYPIQWKGNPVSGWNTTI